MPKSPSVDTNENRENCAVSTSGADGITFVSFSAVHYETICRNIYNDMQSESERKLTIVYGPRDSARENIVREIMKLLRDQDFSYKTRCRGLTFHRNFYDSIIACSHDAAPECVSYERARHEYSVGKYSNRALLISAMDDIADRAQLVHDIRSWCDGTRELVITTNDIGLIRDIENGLPDERLADIYDCSNIPHPVALREDVLALEPARWILTLFAALPYHYYNIESIIRLAENEFVLRFNASLLKMLELLHRSGYLVKHKSESSKNELLAMDPAVRDKIFNSVAVNLKDYSKIINLICDSITTELTDNCVCSSFLSMLLDSALDYIKEKNVDMLRSVSTLVPLMCHTAIVFRKRVHLKERKKTRSLYLYDQCISMSLGGYHLDDVRTARTIARANKNSLERAAYWLAEADELWKKSSYLRKPANAGCRFIDSTILCVRGEICQTAAALLYEDSTEKNADVLPDLSRLCKGGAFQSGNDPKSNEAVYGRREGMEAFAEKQFLAAIEIKLSLPEHVVPNLRQHIVKVYSSLAKLYVGQGRLSRAETYQKKAAGILIALDDSETNSVKAQLADAFESLAEIYLRESDYYNASRYLNNAVYTLKNIDPSPRETFKTTSGQRAITTGDGIAVARRDDVKDALILHRVASLFTKRAEILCAREEVYKEKKLMEQAYEMYTRYNRVAFALPGGDI